MSTELKWPTRILFLVSIAMMAVGCASMAHAGVTRARTRTIHTDLPIVDVIKQLGYGVAGETGELDLTSITDKVDLDLDSVRVAIDGQPRELNVRTMLDVRRHIKGFLDDSGKEGSIAYRYEADLPRKGVHVVRETYIANDYLKLTTTLTGALGEVSWVVAVIEARQTPSGTAITGTLSAYAPLNYRCRLVRRIAHRKAPGIMDATLDQEIVKLEGKGRVLAAKGEGGLLDLVLKTVTRLRARRR